MKRTTEQLQKLASNPFYKLTPEEQAQLHQSNELVSEEAQPKTTGKIGPKENAAVKRTGKLEKHESDPVAE